MTPSLFGWVLLGAVAFSTSSAQGQATMPKRVPAKGSRSLGSEAAPGKF